MRKGIIRLGGLVSALLITTTTALAFSDVSDNSINKEAINYLQENKVVSGYEGDVYKPYAVINRAEFLKIVLEAAEITPGGSNCFTDVKEEWFAGYICKAAELNVVKGYGDGTFKPGDTINFAEASKIIANTFELGTDQSTEGQEWYQQYVKALESNSAIPDNVYDFNQPVTRGVMAEMAWRILAKPENVKISTYEDLQAGKLNLGLEYFIPADADMVWQLNYGNTEKRKSFEAFIMQFPAMTDLIEDLKAQSPENEAIIQKVINTNAEVVLAMKSNIKNSGDEPDFEDAEAYLFINSSYSDELEKVLVKEQGLIITEKPYGSMMKGANSDIYVIRNHDTLFITNSESNIEKIDSKIQFGEDFLNLGNHPYFQMLSEDPFSYMYLADSLVDFENIYEEDATMMIELIPENDQISWVAYGTNMIKEKAKYSLSLFKELPQDKLLAFLEFSSNEKIGAQITKELISMIADEDLQSEKMTTDELLELVNYPMIGGVYLETINNPVFVLMSQLGSDNIEYGKKVISFMEEQILNDPSASVENLTIDGFEVAKNIKEAVEDGTTATFAFIGLRKDGTLVISIYDNDDTAAAFQEKLINGEKLPTTYLKNFGLSEYSYLFGMMDIQEMGKSIMEATPETESLGSIIGLLDKLTVTSEHYDENIDVSTLTLSTK